MAREEDVPGPAPRSGGKQGDSDGAAGRRTEAASAPDAATATAELIAWPGPVRRPGPASTAPSSFAPRDGGVPSSGISSTGRRSRPTPTPTLAASPAPDGAAAATPGSPGLEDAPRRAPGAVSPPLVACRPLAAPLSRGAETARAPASGLARLVASGGFDRMAEGFCAEPPRAGLRLRFALPPAIARHPEICRAEGARAPCAAPDPARLRQEALFWPAVRHDALAAAGAVALDADAPAAAISALLALARSRLGRDAVAVATGRAARIAAAEGWRVAASLHHLRPEPLSALIAAPGAPALLWAGLAGLETWEAAAAGRTSHAGPARRPARGAAAMLAQAGCGARRMLDSRLELRPFRAAAWSGRLAWRDPWTGAETDAERGLDALAALRAGAQANPRRVVTAGLTPWKRRCVAPFLDGPAGPPLHRRSVAAAAGVAEKIDGRVALWGLREPPAGVGLRAPMRLEDGFLRSVGLGLRHTPPASLCAVSWGLHFDATRVGDLERLARSGDPSPAQLARAAALRARIVAAGLTKYNLAGGRDPLPSTVRDRVLVAGQVEDDASLRRGAPGIASNLALLRAARARAPEAFILWRPHPDVVCGMRPGAVPEAEALRFADAVAPDAPVEACLAWADRVECITSLIGFEALLRGLPVAVHGRPFYAGWGLTEELSPDLPHPCPPSLFGAEGAPGFSRGRRLSLDALCALALIRHPRCIDPRTRLPATPERLLDALEQERAAGSRPAARLRRALRMATSWALNRLG